MIDHIGESFKPYKRHIKIIGIIIASLYFVYALVFGNLGLLRYLSMRMEYKEMQARIQHLKGENQKMREAIRALRTDPEYIEALAREKLGLVKEGEIIYRFDK